MGYKDKYIALINATGNTVHDIRANATSNKMISTFKDSLSYFQVIFNNDVSFRDVQILDDSDNKDKKKIIAKPNETINFGDYVDWLGTKWIVDMVDNMGNVYTRATMVRCLSSLKWLDQYSRIKEAFFAIDFESTNVGFVQDKVMTLPSERRYILLQGNVDSRQLKINDRFIFDGRVWKTTAFNSLQGSLIKMIFVEDLINTSTDNLTLRIADYTTKLHVYSLSISNGDTAYLPSSTGTLQLNSQTIDNGLFASLQVNYTSSDPTKYYVSSTGLVTWVSDGTAVIKCQWVIDANIFDTITMTSTIPSPDVYSIALINASTGTEIRQGQSQVYNANVYLNGSPITPNVTWTLFPDTQTGTTTLATFTPAATGTTATIKAGSTLGFVQLKVALVSDPTVFIWFRIKIRSLT